MPILSAIGRKSPKTRALIAAIYAVLRPRRGRHALSAGTDDRRLDQIHRRPARKRPAPPLPRLRRSPLAKTPRSALQRIDGFPQHRVRHRLRLVRGHPPAARRRPRLRTRPALARIPRRRPLAAAGHRPRPLLGPAGRRVPRRSSAPSAKHLREKYGTLAALNAALGTDFDAWYTVFIQPPAYLFPHAVPDATPLATEFDAFKLSAPDWCQTVLSPEGFFKKLYLKPRYSKDIAAYNAAHGTAYASYADVPLPARLPRRRPPLEQEEWRDFTANTLSPLWMKDGVLDTPETRWRDGLPRQSEIQVHRSES